MIASEYACVFAALGTEVHLIDGRHQLLPFLDKEVSAALGKAMSDGGVIFRWGERVIDLLAIHAEKRARSFRNSSVPASVAAERLFSRLRARARAQARFLISGFGLKIDGAKGDLTIPARTLLFTPGQPSVGVVRPNGTVEIRKVAISRDLGSKLVISQGPSPQVESS